VGSPPARPGRRWWRRPDQSIIESIAPKDLGRDFRLLLAAEILTNAGDGFTLAAGPLLVASLTQDPFLVSLAFLAQRLPVLLFALGAGVVADRWDRRRVVTAVNLGRTVVMAALAVTIVSGTVSITLVIGAVFILGATETFADVGSSSLLPRLVPKQRLGVANARLQGAMLLANQLIAPPIGAFLFAIGMALPFTSDAICFALGALLVSRITASRATSSEVDEPKRSLRADLVEGVRWLIGNAPMRTLALTIFLFNVTFGAAWSVLVLYAQQRLGMNDVGFGLLTTAMAVGGLIGTSAYGRLERRFSLGDIMRVGLLIETGTHLALALTTQPAVALGVMVVFGAHAFVWNTTATVIRQRAVPDLVLGRVTGVYDVAWVAGIVIGTPIGGLLATAYGITAPFWFGFVGSALLVVILWRQFSNIAHAADVGAPDPGATGAGTATG
jgi:predicted MFS family arabinose efflux permease